MRKKVAQEEKPKKSKAKKVLTRPQQLGWSSTDEDEIARRRWRGQTDIIRIEALEKEHLLFGTFRVSSGSGNTYDVEMRDLAGFNNACGCADYQTNQLGTCKHIEGVRSALQKGKARAFKQGTETGSPRIEIFLARCGEARPTIFWPVGGDKVSTTIRKQLGKWLNGKNELVQEPRKIETLLIACNALPQKLRQSIRVSQHFGPWLQRAKQLAAREKAKQKYETPKNLLNAKLLPYQKEGMAHLAFNERALLADEMGLGKTIQAIAACELLKKTKKIKRVLVVSPASVKSEWEEQVERFTDSATRVIFGPRQQRLHAYQNDVPFYTIVNYEQVVSDLEDINTLLKPDVVVLDEAQRIKNWQTRTAKRVKALKSDYAFVLTGTPVENRIDEIYSIVQFLDPDIFGPLFRFNRDFYELDERGRPVGFKNMQELHERLKIIMLRRRKADVENELPERSIRNYFVGMEPEQRLRYQDYEAKAAQIIAIGKRRALLPKEFERLQMFLACMRMICDTPAILDPSCRISPKLDELEKILGDFLQEEDSKIIIFSEWQTMLKMVGELAGEMGVEYAWHTGSVPQQQRRAEITRFKNDSSCRLFLTTDAGATGLNLQTANVVINMDLPWNPAKLEQRIARAWRKGQSRKVSVVNLVTEHSIEHNILFILGQKQAMADGVLDGTGDFDKLEMPSGRKAMIDRMAAMMEAQTPPPRILTVEEALLADLQVRHDAALLLVEARLVGEGREHMVVVLNCDQTTITTEQMRLNERHNAADLPVDIINHTTWETMQRLATTGLLAFTTTTSRIIYRAKENSPAEQEENLRQAA